MDIETLRKGSALHRSKQRLERIVGELNDHADSVKDQPDKAVTLMIDILGDYPEFFEDSMALSALLVSAAKKAEDKLDATKAEFEAL